MRLLIALIIAIAAPALAQAQNFSSATYTPQTQSFNGPSQTGTPSLADLVLVNHFNPSSNTFSTAGLTPGSFASSADVQNLNARVDQAFQQFNRGTAAVAAMANSWMPSAPGRTTWAINGAAFQSEVGGGISLAHRLNLTIPIAVTAAYGNGGGTAHVGRVGLMGEF